MNPSSAAPRPKLRPDLLEGKSARAHAHDSLSNFESQRLEPLRPEDELARLAEGRVQRPQYILKPYRQKRLLRRVRAVEGRRTSERRWWTTSIAARADTPRLIGRDGAGDSHGSRELFRSNGEACRQCGTHGGPHAYSVVSRASSTRASASATLSASRLRDSCGGELSASKKA
ncbi:uncharacterized protein BcabD6B2_44300 [Babesia caballi]|uniref:Uncharacterized protein n=1 Tax=Babesia caballi TaxID=5871 RepID=A0AAV4LZC7_BABCB|nr:hypothetical protein BcabD6B2_44300 [Babesia caballi]